MAVVFSEIPDDSSRSSDNTDNDIESVFNKTCDKGRDKNQEEEYKEEDNQNQTQEDDCCCKPISNNSSNLSVTIPDENDVTMLLDINEPRSPRPQSDKTKTSFAGSTIKEFMEESIRLADEETTKTTKTEEPKPAVPASCNGKFCVIM